GVAVEVEEDAGSQVVFPLPPVYNQVTESQFVIIIGIHARKDAALKLKCVDVVVAGWAGLSSTFTARTKDTRGFGPADDSFVLSVLSSKTYVEKGHTDAWLPIVGPGTKESSSPSWSVASSSLLLSESSDFSQAAKAAAKWERRRVGSGSGTVAVQLSYCLMSPLMNSSGNLAQAAQDNDWRPRGHRRPHVAFIVQAIQTITTLRHKRPQLEAPPTPAGGLVAEFFSLPFWRFRGRFFAIPSFGSKR
ncbi:hypothetical protein THAOC_04384, partial [Thalassiosira oceanica]